MSAKRKIKSFLQDEDGATAIEYALIVSLLAVSAIPALSGLGSKVSDTFNAVAQALDDAPPLPAGKPGPTS